MPPPPEAVVLRFGASYAIDEPGEVALEDYARVLTKAEAAEGLRDPSDPRRVTGLRVSGLAASPAPAVLADLEAFAGSLVTQTPGGGLGWS